MCNVKVATTILEVLETMTQDEEVFTAFDVTKKVRGVIADNVRHREVRDIVNNEFQTGQMQNYNRDLCVLNFPNAPQALVYYPDGKSASDHPLVDVTDDTDMDNTDSIIDDDNILVATAEGRVNIPKKLLDKIAPVGGSYDIVFSGTVYAKAPNKDGRVRLTLSELGINSNKVKVTVDTNNDTIQIESV